MYAKVIVDIANTAVDKTFDYRVPENLDLKSGQRVFVPFGNTKKEGIILELLDSTEIPLNKLKSIISAIDDNVIITADQLKLAGYVREKYHSSLAFALRQMYPSKLRGQRISEKKAKMVTLKKLSNIELIELKESCMDKTGAVKYPTRLETINALLANDELYSKLNKNAVKYLADKGYANVYESTDRRVPYKKLEATLQNITPSVEQKSAIDRINALVDSSERHTALLHGVTGSGKTLVYLECMQHALAAEKTAMLLVPEISLTPQLYSLLDGRFPGHVALIHSALSDGERHDEWKRLLTGQAKIAMGARSCAFMPLQNLGLIIIDEEHEPGYKSESHPPYHAAEIARARAAISGATLVLGSATPRLESYMKAKFGIYELIELSERVLGLNLPEINVVDMREEFKAGNTSCVSELLRKKLLAVFAEGKQALLFLNRRGYAGSVQCASCGCVIMCPHCDVPLKYHSTSGKLLCHYCGFNSAFTKKCPDCGAPHLRPVGVGTQQLEAQIKGLFPAARVLRMDYDTTRKKDSHEQIYSDFAAGKADILVGTQMIARGFDFPKVKLAAIINADTMLAEGNYSASERAFSLIEQVGGRAGRRDAGEVIIQTYSPGDFVIECAKMHDYTGFYKNEVKSREKHEMPPYTKIFRIVITSQKPEVGQKALCELETKLKKVTEQFSSDVKLFVAGSAPIEKLQDKYRFHIIIKTATNKRTAEFSMAIYEIYETTKISGCVTAIEENPQQLL